MKIFFHGFWPDFNRNHNYFTEVLRQKYDVEVLTAPTTDLDLMFVEGRQNLNTDKDSYARGIPKVGYTGEPSTVYSANPQSVDLLLSMGKTQGNNLYHPHWLIDIDWFDKVGTDFLTTSVALDPLSDFLERDPNKFMKSKFCTFIVKSIRAAGGSPRIPFTQHLMNTYKHVDCPSVALHNCDWNVDIDTSIYPNKGNGFRPGDKKEFMSHYKFIVAFENTYDHYYVSEKVLGPMATNTIPIYWGGDQVLEDFNEKAMIKLDEGFNYSDAVERIKEVDENDDLFLQYISEPCFKDNIINDKYSPAYVLERIEKIL